MARSQVWTSTFQAALFSLLTAIAAHHLSEWAISSVADSFGEFTQDNWKFYTKEVPKLLGCNLCLNPLRYWWQIWLERILPTRPRSAQSAAERQEFQSSDNEQEEKIIKQWIAQGKIKRASVSWGNIFAKWVLDLSIGNLWACFVMELLNRIAAFTSPSKLFTGLRSEILVNWIVCFFTPSPWISLMAFVIVPAYKRIVFEDGICLVVTVFFGAFAGVLVPWLMTFDVVKEAVHNATLTANSTQYNSTTSAALEL